MGSSGPLITTLLLFFILISLVSRQKSRSKLRQPPRLSETIPFVSNAWQFMTNKRLFINRTREALRASPVVQCRLGPMTLHLVSGGSTVSAVFRSSFTSDPWILRILQHTAGYASTDLAKFSADDSGCATLPRKDSTGSTAPEKRIWHAMHRTHEEGLVSAHSVGAFSASFQECFREELSTLPVGNWVEVRVSDFLKKHMSIAATRSVLGSRILEVNAGFIDTFWEYEQFGESLSFGLPSWLNRRAISARERFRCMCRKWYKLADQEFDWDTVALHQDEEWEPIFGSQISRGLARWGKQFSFSVESFGAAYALLLFGLHANTIPICIWMVMEIIKDPDLYHQIKDEVSQANITDGALAGNFDFQRLASMPLLQSVYTETLRVHVSILVTRTATEPVVIGGYNIPKGSVFQAPTEVAHLDEIVWGTPDHPASEFWTYRHVKEVEKTDSTGYVTKKLEFSIAARGGNYFPFGGGISICAGRNFAKPEVLLTVAMIISNFDIEFIEWLKLDGTHSERPALDNTGYANAAATPPDREMKVMWRRI
ncbi:cytochrome P450 [Zopfia rhizophila CBS 207.26]|uniref:Cytochrome P450 n=1 Tax=Zopfia rhizophila CBS 207.26 TaxID=1314779 RepID=A0A6A6DHU1_9PEZI|nr:cytochrome P450 [Zopfia rhizophila CBS 207.26]